MNEITTVSLENEMDLILANKQSMRLAELAGLTLSAQTIFATAVSEVSRTALDQRNAAQLTLYTSVKTDREKFIIAIITDASGQLTEKQQAGYSYAKRLVGDFNITRSGAVTQIELRVGVPPAIHFGDLQIEKWRRVINVTAEVSPYEEIKRKNKQLVELSEKLSGSEARYKELTNTLPLLIFTLDKHGKTIYGNQWLYDYTGRNLALWKESIHPDDQPLLTGLLESNWDDMASIPLEWRLMEAATGTYRWHSGMATPVRNEAAAFAGWHLFLADIHAQKMVEAALKDNRELKETQKVLETKILELNRSNQQLAQFAYVASHDLQEPLRKIGVYSDLLQTRFGDKLRSEGHALFDNMIKSTQRMKNLIDDVLAYSTISDNSEAFRVLELDQLIADIVAGFDLRIQEAGAEILVGPLPAVRGNAPQFKQLFENLLSNALKFTEPGRRPRIEVFAHSGGQEVQIVFKDNGIGFDQAHVEKIFGLFQRLHTRDQYSGTGIGLAICKKIVQIHGGTIQAEGHPGEGAEFLIRLPREEV